MTRIKITHIITGLNMGGAETMLFKLLKYIDKENYDIKVISMMDEGVYGERIRALGFEVISLNMKPEKLDFKGFLKAKKVIKNTDIIQTWLYHADLFGYLLSKFSKVKKIVWGIRRSNLDVDKNKKSTILVAKLNAKLSSKVDTIVSCSKKAKETHKNMGFSEHNLIVIPNGFELDHYYKSLNARDYLSQIINVKENTPIVSHVARWNTLKDHENFFKALSALNKKNIPIHAVLCGPNINEDNAELMELVNKYNISDIVSLLGPRDDVPGIMAGSDLFVSSSSGEGFPNVIGEAMACETPCVVTDVGDSAYVVGDTGIVVPSKDSEALAEGISDLITLSSEDRQNMGKKARHRVIENFEIKKVTNQFEKLYIS